ncbi:putative 2-oxoadipate dehydrogenase complex component E1 homolog [Rhynchophorus ferrugineus]|uniref:putative 2-oxoadipate dehydrogenase complex component E1 homolog n=1 Tax=Rhynchophorus ferrugineus TaxID=354439 RepID=UPI003FCE5681
MSFSVYRLVKNRHNKLHVAHKYLYRFYQTDNVFGYKKKPSSSYTVSKQVLQKRCNASNLYRLVEAYRKYGHRYSSVDPVSFAKFTSNDEELDVRRYGFENTHEIIDSLDGIVVGIPSSKVALGDVIDYLNKVYCTYIAAEFDYLESEEEREWFADQLESLANSTIDIPTKRTILTLLIQSEAFDNFLAKKFSSVKRYGAEGSENMMTVFHEIFQSAAKDNLEQIVLAMPHRGRLNLLTGLLRYPPAQMFYKLRGNPDFPEKYQCNGDVLSHLVSSTNLEFDDKSIHVSLLFNPSHLEAVNPVSMGKTRAKQLTCQDGDYGHNKLWGDKILNVQVHGDAALTGQGINQECLELSGVPHFEIGGTVHLVVNNQVGFTTPADRGRSSRYCTDLAKIVSAPVIHVNGDHPEEVLKATRLACNYQRRFRKDVFINMNCFRKWGHNEMDDPTFTNPALYSVINSRRSVPQLYRSKLEGEEVISDKECDELYDEYFDWLNEELKAADEWEAEDSYFKEQWQNISQPDEAITIWDTGIASDVMTFVGLKSVHYPSNFAIHPTIARGHVNNRLTRITDGKGIDWSTAEALAVGSLLLEGHNVRISGQDVGRGTFSQRHGMLVDQETNSIYIPLNDMQPNQGYFEIANSILSEEAVLGFEYGMSIENPNNLIVWEAQFGDFFNGAQVIFDTFISSGEAKWLAQSGLTVLLPHGYDGAGPEHSSARIERFLQLTDSKEDRVDAETVNMQVCQPSTPAQYFHLLRRQMIRPFRKPLIVITPKTLLRDPECVSNFAEMERGTHFNPVIGDRKVSPANVTRVLLTSGRHYYTLDKERQSVGIDDTAIVRVESFCPFPASELLAELSLYGNAKVFIWCQEEPQNMGAWSFVKRRFENLIGKPIKFSGRPTAATPATGVGKIHTQQQRDLITIPFVM